MADNASRTDTDREAEGHDVLGDEFIPGDTLSADTTPETGPVEPLPAAKRRWRKPLLLIAPIILIVGAFAFYLHGGRYESTDNAYLQSGLVSVSPNVAGRVVAIEVRNNQHVKKGDVLFLLDPAPYRAAVAEAQAQLAAAKTEVGSLRANYAQGASELAAAQTRVRFAEREAARQKELVAEGISSQAQYDQAQLAAQTARQSIQTTQQQNASVQAQLTGNVNAPLGQQPGVQRAQAALDRARLNLGYTIIRAAQDGIVAQGRPAPGRRLRHGLEAGVQPGGDADVGRGEFQGEPAPLHAARPARHGQDRRLPRSRSDRPCHELQPRHGQQFLGASG